MWGGDVGDVGLRVMGLGDVGLNVWGWGRCGAEDVGRCGAGGCVGEGQGCVSRRGYRRGVARERGGATDGAGYRWWEHKVGGALEGGGACPVAWGRRY